MCIRWQLHKPPPISSHFEVNDERRRRRRRLFSVTIIIIMCLRSELRGCSRPFLKREAGAVAQQLDAAVVSSSSLRYAYIQQILCGAFIMHPKQRPISANNINTHFMVYTFGKPLRSKQASSFFCCGVFTLTFCNNNMMLVIWSECSKCFKCLFVQCLLRMFIRTGLAVLISAQTG